ncbi:ABC-type spermidine/putrescine transport system permease subunit II [Bradyrhizobium sp. USDA 3686]|uniref:hypothetical protein n=1 Tax=Bradyrhizobium canariense TaxID=255045 RepID=UPI00195DDE6D|nr:hypothetical protein [Bradyrhizobium canariense]MBM7487950.1 ABC-type spermidine/putrescine transport system permease subunit II [Bradyrhizobium canariense]
MLSKRSTLGTRETLSANKMVSKRIADIVLVLCVSFIVALNGRFPGVPCRRNGIYGLRCTRLDFSIPGDDSSTQWFDKPWDHSYLWSGFNNSLLLAITVTAVATAIGASAGLAISRMSPRWRDLVTTAFLSRSFYRAW